MYNIKFEHKSLDKYVVGFNNEVIDYDYNKILEQFREFGHSSIGDFILKMHFEENVAGRREYNIEKRNRKYAVKMYRQRYKEAKLEIRNEYKLKGIRLNPDELDEMVYSRLDSKNLYIRFNAIGELEKVFLKSLLVLTKEEAVANIPSISATSIKEVFSAMRETYNFKSLGLLVRGTYRISEKNRLLIHLGEKIVILDAFDFLSLFDIDLNFVLELQKVKCIQYKEFKTQMETYKSNEELIKKTNLPKINAVLNEKVRMVYSCLMLKGKTVMNSSLMVEGFSVFTYPIKVIMADLRIEDTKQNVKIIADSINILTSLGIINKISVSKLRKLGREDLIYDTKKGYDNNYFYIKPIDLNEVEEKATIFKKECIRIGHISHKIISTAFDEKIANKVFNRLKENFYTFNRLSKYIKDYGFRKVIEIRDRFLDDIDKIIYYFENLMLDYTLDDFNKIDEENENEEDDDQLPF